MQIGFQPITRSQCLPTQNKPPLSSFHASPLSIAPIASAVRWNLAGRRHIDGHRRTSWVLNCVCKMLPLALQSLWARTFQSNGPADADMLDRRCDSMLGLVIRLKKHGESSSHCAPLAAYCRNNFPPEHNVVDSDGGVCQTSNPQSKPSFRSASAGLRYRSSRG